MTLGPIQSLIDKQDNFELIRDEIASIIALETASQQVLAVTAGEDPTLWELKVYTERANPWELYLNGEVTTPIVNVWYDSYNSDGGASDTIQRQKVDGLFNIDCYGRGTSQASGAGHVAGDESAAKEAQRCIRLVRNIIMSAHYTYLNMRGVVWRRWPQVHTMFQPQETDRASQAVMACRLGLSVQFNEFSPQYEAETIELISATVNRASDGALYFEAQFDE